MDSGPEVLGTLRCWDRTPPGTQFFFASVSHRLPSVVCLASDRQHDSTTEDLEIEELQPLLDVSREAERLDAIASIRPCFRLSLIHI